MKPSFGSAVKDGVLRYTSASAIQTFDPDTYAGCNRRFYFTRVLGVKEPTTASQRIGHEGHGQLEHYTRTSEDVLQPFARAGKHLVPTPGPDLEVEVAFAQEEATRAAIALREEFAALDGVPGFDRAREHEIERLAGLALAGVPLVGYIDLRHRRGEYIDADGSLRQEVAPGKTAEIVDYKFTSSIDSFGKTALEMLSTVQMVSYALQTANVMPDIEIIREGHVQFQTRGAKTARKVTALTTVDEARRKGERITSVVRAMKDVSKAARVEDVEPWAPSCDAYRGCHHRAICPFRPNTTVYDLLKVTRKEGETMATLFDSDAADSQQNGAAATTGLFGGAVTPAAPPRLPPASQAEYDAQKAAEKERLLADYGACAACGAKLSGENASRPPSGVAVHIGCPKRLRPDSVNPADALPPAPGEIADPLPPETVASISDPEVRRRAEEHGTAVAAAAPPPLPGRTEGGGKCPGGSLRVQLSQEQAGKKKYVCQTCGKELRIKPSADFTSATLPGHLRPKAEASAAPPPIPAQVPPPLPVSASAPLSVPSTLLPPPMPPSEISVRSPSDIVFDISSLAAAKKAAAEGRTNEAIMHALIAIAEQECGR